MQVNDLAANDTTRRIICNSLQVAGPKSGVNVVQKAKEAVNIGKVVGALNKISDILKVGAMHPHSLKYMRIHCISLYLPPAQSDAHHTLSFNL